MKCHNGIGQKHSRRLTGLEKREGPALEAEAPPSSVIGHYGQQYQPSFPIMPHQSTSRFSSTTTPVLLCFLLVISLFPSAFHFLWTLPFSLLGLTASSPPQPTTTQSVLQQPSSMSWFQKQFTLPSKSRGSYLITDQVISSLPEIRDYKVGLLNLFVQHTSCALSLNENCEF